MESPTRFTYPAKDGTEIVGYRWDPAGRPRGVVQLTHGMGEHVQRYDALARALTGRGLVVYGQDHRGHGATARHADELGQLGPDGWTQLVGDIDLLVSRIRDEQPGLPLVLLGPVTDVGFYRLVNEAAGPNVIQLRDALPGQHHVGERTGHG